MSVPDLSRLNQGVGAHGASEASGVGAPVPDGNGNERSEFPGPEGLVRYVAEPDTSDARPMPAAKRVGRPRQYDGRLRVPMTDEQREKVEALRAAAGCSAAEAIRRLIDGAPVPAPVVRAAVDPDDYRALLDALAGIRTELYRGVGNLYRLTRDAYAAWQVPEPDQLDELRADLARGLGDLEALAARVREVSPW